MKLVKVTKRNLAFVDLVDWLGEIVELTKTELISAHYNGRDAHKKGKANGHCL